MWLDFWAIEGFSAVYDAFLVGDSGHLGTANWAPGQLGNGDNWDPGQLKDKEIFCVPFFPVI